MSEPLGMIRRPCPAVLPRPRLTGLVDEVLTRRLTTVVAGAGFGKSTLLAGWAAVSEAVWCEFSAADAELQSFADTITRAFAARYPSVAGLAAGGDIADRDNLAAADGLVAALVEAFHKHPAAPILAVFDDVHELGSASPPARVLEGIVRQAPAWMHVVVGSRTQPPFPVDRLRGRGQVLEVDATMLAFTPDEVSEVLLARGLVGDDLRNELTTLTGGWPAAVSLCVDALVRAPQERRAHVLQSIAREEGPLFSYLAEEVVAAESHDARCLLRAVTPLDRFTPALCTELGLPGADQVVSDLVRRGVLLERVGTDGGWVRLHALTRAFCRDHLPLSDSDRADLLRGAARWYEVHDLLDDALRALEAADDNDGLVAFVRRHAESLVKRNPSLLLRALEHCVSAAPDLEIYVARALWQVGDHDAAAAAFERIAGAEGEISEEVAASLAELYMHRGEFDRGRALLDRMTAGESSPSVRAQVLYVRGWLLGHDGRAREGAALAEASAHLAEAAGDYRQNAISLGMWADFAATYGDHATYDAVMPRAFAAAEKSGDTAFIDVTRVHRCRHAIAEGRYLEALDHADAALRAVDVMPPAAALRRAGHISGTLTYRAVALLQLGRIDEAVHDLLEARSVALTQAPDQLGAIAMTLGAAHRARGDVALARAAAADAVEHLQAAGAVHEVLHAQLALATILAADEPDAALVLARSGLAELEGPDIELYVDGGWVELLVGEHARARALAEAAVADARKNQTPWALASSLELMALTTVPPSTQLLDEAAVMWERAGAEVYGACARYASAVLAREPVARAQAPRWARRLLARGVRMDPPIAGLLGVLPRVTRSGTEVRTLGGFAVVRDGKPLPASAWPSKKSRDLLKVLIARRGAATHREVLMSVLWPDDDPDHLSRRLAVVVSGLRHTLDPDKTWPPDYFVRSDSDSISVDLDHLDVDVERFLAIADRAFDPGRASDLDPDDATVLLESAEALYNGEFLEEDLYDEWAIPLRERARATFIAVEIAIARRAAESGEHPMAISRYLRILERDPYDEGAHLGLVQASTASGRHGEARRHYRSYVTRMRELDVEPAPFPASAGPASI